MTQTVIKIDDNTIKVELGTREKTITIEELLEQKALLETKISNFDARATADRLALTTRLTTVTDTIQAAVDAGIILP